MNKKFHTNSASLGDRCNLDTAYLPSEVFSSFLFEPRELVPFESSWKSQKEKRNLLRANRSSAQSVWLLQHEPCYTLGRGSDKKYVLFDLETPPFPCYRIDRGGEVTHHLPGQLVVYLVLDLFRYQTDLHWYLRRIEEVIIDVLHQIGLTGYRIDGLTGIWVENFKIASIGVGCSGWITQHGFALNVNCDLFGFDEIVPCGLLGKKVGRLDYWIPDLTVEKIQPFVKRSLEKHFGFIWKDS